MPVDCTALAPIPLLAASDITLNHGLGFGLIPLGAFVLFKGRF